MGLWDLDLILQWSLGWGVEDKVLVPPPDALRAALVLVWIFTLLCNQRKLRRAAQAGDEAAARSVVLPAFSPLLKWYACTPSPLPRVYLLTLPSPGWLSGLPFSASLPAR